MRIFQQVVIFFLVLPLVTLGSLSVARAADGSRFIPECVAEGNAACDSVEVFVWLAVAIGRYIFTFVGAVALLFFVYGGFTMIISRGNAETVNRGTKAMTAAVIGLVVAFSGYALITFLGKSVGLQQRYLINYQWEKLENNNFWV